MTHRLDVNMLLAAIWENHPQHGLGFNWLMGKQIAVCPLCELGFIRISTNPKVFGASMASSRDLLRRFLAERAVLRIADDLPALGSHPQRSDQVTDWYLAALAEKHGMKLATLDRKIKHRAVVVVG